MGPVTTTEFEPPDAVLVNRRWVKLGTADWAAGANDILNEHGAVSGTVAYDLRHQARWRARRLINVLVALGLKERWELVEHVNHRGDGWVWTVEYIVGRRSDG